MKGTYKKIMGRIIVSIALLTLLLAPTLAQETTPEPLPPTPIPTFTETPTPLPLPTETPTLLPTFTEPPTLFPTLTETPTALPTFTPESTAETTATVTPMATLTQTSTSLATNTLTPTPTPAPYFAENSIVSAQAIVTTSVDYVVVDNGDELMQVFTDLETITVPNPFRIFLRGGTYIVTQQLALEPFVHVKIYGLGASATIIQDAAEISLFDARFATLELHDLTIIGNTTSLAFGGVLIHGQTSIIRSIIQNSSNGSSQDPITYGGGAIFMGLPDDFLTIQDSIIRNNHSSGGGGAIQISEGGTRITCTRFENNSATSFGGAILHTNNGDDFRVWNTIFSGNTATSGGGAIYNSVPNYPLDAQQNFWPPNYGNAPATGTDSVGSDSPSNVVNTANFVTNFSNFATSCPKAVQEIDPLVPSQELETYYGVLTVNQRWNNSELQEILEGVRNTAIALAIQSYHSPLDAFKIVMIGEGQANRRDIQVTKSTTAGDICETSNGGNPRTIICGANVVMSDNLIIHELGHVFVGRTGGYAPGNDSFFGRTLSPTDPCISAPGQQRNQCTPPLIGTPTGPTPTASGVVYDNTGRANVFGLTGLGPNDWSRNGPSKERGWGSAVLTLPAPQSFQQNPRTDPAQTDAEIDEAAADMFLNWVDYKINHNERIINVYIGGFRNVDWTAPTCYSAAVDQPAPCPEGIATEDPDFKPSPPPLPTTDPNYVTFMPGTEPGAARYEWINYTMIHLFAVNNWNYVP